MGGPLPFTGVVPVIISGLGIGVSGGQAIELTQLDVSIVTEGFAGPLPINSKIRIDGSIIKPTTYEMNYPDRFPPPVYYDRVKQGVGFLIDALTCQTLIDQLTAALGELTPEI